MNQLQKNNDEIQKWFMGMGFENPYAATINMITNNIDNQTRDDTITHEIAHYLKEVMCIKGDSEAFATSHHD